MAVADSEYCFSYINIGAYGRESDSNVLKATEFGRTIYSGSLDLPDPKPLVNEPESTVLPYVFVADEAFALCKNLWRPYPRKNLTYEKQIFNYRLSRSRRFLECTFGILANKWRIFHRPIDVGAEFADVIIKACCALHNFVRKRDGYNFEDALTCALDSIVSQGTRGYQNGIQVRDYFAKYLCSQRGKYLGRTLC